MAVETGTYISDFVITNPANTDLANETDDHIRLIKSFLKATFPGTSGDRYDEPVTATSSQIDSWDARLTTLEAQATSISGAQSGFAEVPQNGTHSVTGLGFKPRHIIVFLTDEFPGLYASYWTIGMTSWSETDDDSNIAVAAIGSGNIAGTNTVQTLYDLHTIYGNSQNSSSGIADIENVDSDGFDIVMKRIDSIYVLWAAFQ